jgi:hypothetical protein
MKDPIAGEATIEEGRMTIFIAKLNTEESEKATKNYSTYPGSL